MDKELYEKMKKFVVETARFEEGIFNGCDGIHKIGLPIRTYLMIRPKWSPCDGACSILVFSDSISRSTLKIPFNSHEWNLGPFVHYSTRKELVELLKELTEEPRPLIWR